jgi:radical SAM superfamily enzyme YgiQ (UPF0313 family)
MVNASFVFGMDDDDESVFDRTVEWAIQQGIETATFHILTPYPSTALYKRIAAEGRLTSSNWDLFDTRHTVFQPKRLTPESLEAGYWHAYREFYRWKNIIQASHAHDGFTKQLRHIAYAGGWKKFEPMWDWVIRAKRVANLLPVLETVLAGFNNLHTDKKSVEISPAPNRITSR